MAHQFDVDLQHLKDQLIAMAGLVERALDFDIEGFDRRDPVSISNVRQIEGKINDYHKAVDEICIKLVALNQPMARDLRFIISAIKINADLERMGDQAVNIAGNVTRYLTHEPLAGIEDIPEMCSKVRSMVRDAIDAFVRYDVMLAQEVLTRDDAVDDLKDKVFKDALVLMKASPDKVDAGLDLILVARNLEKVADHATNMAEEIIFVVSGTDIRHPSRPAKVVKG